VFIKTYRSALNTAIKFIDDLEEIIDRIDSEKTRPKKDKPGSDTLYKLLAACKTYDMDGVDREMAEIEAYEYKSQDGLVDWLKNNFSEGNFDAVNEKLTALVNEEG